MQRDLYIDQIDGVSIADLKSRYHSIVPAKLQALDIERYATIPEALAKRGDQAHLTRKELVTLVEWKVSHGKFRPTLKGLAQQNAEEFVEAVTQDAFAIDDDAAALKELTKLRGVGPATAALLLAVHKPMHVPFFSDELFRWCFFEDKPGCGWDRKIKYTPKEYTDLVQQVRKLRDRLKSGGSSISAVDIEKAAYVLGKTGDTGVGALSDKKPDKPKPKRKASTDEPVDQATNDETKHESKFRRTSRQKKS